MIGTGPHFTEQVQAEFRNATFQPTYEEQEDGQDQEEQGVVVRILVRGYPDSESSKSFGVPARAFAALLRTAGYEMSSIGEERVNEP